MKIEKYRIVEENTGLKSTFYVQGLTPLIKDYGFLGLRTRYVLEWVYLTMSGEVAVYDTPAFTLARFDNLPDARKTVAGWLTPKENPETLIHEVDGPTYAVDTRSLLKLYRAAIIEQEGNDLLDYDYSTLNDHQKEIIRSL